EWNDGLGNCNTSLGPHFWINQPGPTGGGPGSLFANMVDNVGVSNGAWHTIASPGGILAANQFQHVVFTYDETTGLAALYLNGASVASQNLGVFTPNAGLTYNMYLGMRPSTGCYPAQFFNGLLDEPTLFSNALSKLQIQDIYAAGSAGKLLAPSNVTANLTI